MNCLRNTPLKLLNTMGVNGTVPHLVEWDDTDDLTAFFTDNRYEPLRNKGVKVIGGGSNILFATTQPDYTLLHCTSTTMEVIKTNCENVVVRLAAGCQLDKAIKWLCDNKLWGLENLSLIPGTIGGATVQNVGAYGVEFGNLVAAVHCYDRKINQEVTLYPPRLNYGYRDSLFKHCDERYIVIATDVAVSRIPNPVLGYGRLAEALEPLGEKLTPGDVRNEIIAVRNAKLPAVDEIGSAGSFFKNPVVTPEECEQVKQLAAERGIDPTTVPAYEVKLPNAQKAVKLSAAWLIDQSGWKGYISGNVGTWPTQPLVLVNLTGKATPDEIMQLAHDIVADVKKKWDITLEKEVLIY